MRNPARGCWPLSRSRGMTVNRPRRWPSSEREYTMVTTTEKVKIVIAGGGFAGLERGHVARQDTRTPAGYRGDAREPRELRAVHSDAARSRGGRSVPRRHRQSAATHSSSRERRRSRGARHRHGRARGALRRGRRTARRSTWRSTICSLRWDRRQTSSMFPAWASGP